MTTATLETKHAPLIFLGGIATAGIIWLATRSSVQAFALSAFIDPYSVADLAATLPADEDEFILAAWDIAGSDIHYSGFGSDIKFSATTVYCQRCFLATQVLKIGAGNCIGKSVLLTSLLRNRLPPERVYLAVGQLNTDHTQPSGHAWVIVQRQDSDWYLLESTIAPPVPPLSPWKTASALESIYSPEAMVNDQMLVCMDAELCITVKKASCPCQLEQSGIWA